MDGNGTIRSLLLLTLAVVLLLGGGVSSAPSSSPARIVNGLVSNAASALLKRISLLKVTTKTAIAGRPLMKFESGYVVETVFDGSKLGIEPHSVEVLPNGELLILDSANSNLYKMSSSLSLYSRPKLVAGSPEGNSGHVDGRPREARLNHPKGLTVDDKGNIYIADTVNMAIRKIGDSGVTTIAGGKSGKGGGHVDGPSEDAKFSDDFDVVYVGSSCSLLVIDRGNRAIREIQLHFDDCAYQYGSGFPLGFAVLLAAGFFGYMLAMLQHRVTAIVSSQNDHETTKPNFSPNPYQKPLKSSMRPPLIPTEDSEPEKQEEGFFGSLGKLFAGAGSSGMEILGAMFPIFKRSSPSYEQVHQYHQYQQKQTNGWPLQESFVIPDEDEPPSIEARDTTPKKTYAFMSKDAEKMQQWRQSRAFYSNGGWEGGDYTHQQQQQQQQLYAQQQHNSQQKQHNSQQKQQLQQKQQQQQQHHHHRYHSSIPHTYYEENCEKTKEIVFGAVQEQKREAVVKPVDYGDSAYDHHNIRLRKGYSHGY